MPRKRSPEKEFKAYEELGKTLISIIKVGDMVTFETPQGQKQKGRAVMRSSHGGWVLNCGGRYGTPGLVDSSNIVSVRVARAKRGRP